MLSDVLKERAGQHRQAEFDVEDDEEDAQEAFPDAHSQKLSRIGNDGRRQEQRGGDRDEAFARGHVFEDRVIGKASESIEQCAADEEGLVAVDNPAADATEVVQERDQLELPVIAQELVHEAAGLDGLICLHLVQPLDRTGRQDRIGTEKEEPFAHSSRDISYRPALSGRSQYPQAELHLRLT